MLAVTSADIICDGVFIYHRLSPECGSVLLRFFFWGSAARKRRTPLVLNSDSSSSVIIQYIIENEFYLSRDLAFVG